MKLGFLLLKADLDLAKEEVLSVLGHPPYELHENLLIAECIEGEEKLLSRRLGQVNAIHSVLFSCELANLEEKMKSFDWKRAYNGNFCIRVHELHYARGQHGGKIPAEASIPFNAISPTAMEKTLAAYVWRSLAASTIKPEVKLRGSTTPIHVFVSKNIAVCTLLLFELNFQFEERRPHLRAFTHSGSMHPRLARSIVNLTGANNGDIIMDPCCGSGGLLIEAAHSGMKTEGYDINRKMIWGTIRNMAQQKLLDYKVTCKDALTLEGKWDYVVTDLPYGLNSLVVGEGKRRVSMKQKDGKKDVVQFYVLFFSMLKRVLQKRAVVVLSQMVDGKTLAREAGLTIEKEFSQYVHGSLTRKILVLTP